MISIIMDGGCGWVSLVDSLSCLAFFLYHGNSASIIQLFKYAIAASRITLCSLS
jgi:hypothetical protein